LPEAISNTSPLLYLHRIGALDLLQGLFALVWTPGAVLAELQEGRLRGYDVPDPARLEWLQRVEPQHTPSEWLTLDLGAGELVVMALALERPGHIVLLDDALARRTAQAAGLDVWGTLRVLVEAKSAGLIGRIEPFVDNLAQAGLWLSEEIRRRVLALAGE